MSDEEAPLEFFIPEVGSAWTGIDQPAVGEKAKVVVAMVTNPFVSAKYGQQEPTVVLVGRDQHNQPSQLAYPLWMFLDLYVPDYIPCLYRIVPKKSSEAEPRVEYKQAQWEFAGNGEADDDQG